MTAYQDVQRLVDHGETGWVARGLAGPTSAELGILCARAGWHLVHVDLRAVRDRKDLMRALADGLGLPDYFGGNWDALDECLGDLRAQQGGLVLRLKGLGAVPPALAGTLVDVLAGQIDEGESFVIVADPPLPDHARTGPEPTGTGGDAS